MRPKPILGLVAQLAAAAKLPAATAAMAVAANKIALAPGTVFYRSIGGGALICLALLTAKQSPAMTGKFINIVLPISAYVTIGFEHYLSALFFFQTAMASGYAIDTVQLFKFIAAATAGNFLGGAILVGMGLSQIPKEQRK